MKSLVVVGNVGQVSGNRTVGKQSGVYCALERCQTDISRKIKIDELQKERYIVVHLVA